MQDFTHFLVAAQSKRIVIFGERIRRRITDTEQEMFLIFSYRTVFEKIQNLSSICWKWYIIIIVGTFWCQIFVVIFRECRERSWRGSDTQKDSVSLSFKSVARFRVVKLVQNRQNLSLLLLFIQTNFRGERSQENIIHLISISVYI